MCVILFLQICVSALEAEIFQIKNIEQCQERINPGMLLVFDIDNTLIETAQSLGSDQWFSHRVEENIQRGMSKAEGLAVALGEWTAIQNKTKVKLVESPTARFIQNLQKDGWVVMGLTTRGLELASKTIEQLKSVGIDFGNPVPVFEELFFEQTPPVIYRRGIVFCSGMNKGSMLFQVFKKTGYQPKKVLFVDDKEKYLRDVEKACGEHQIPFVGLRYGFLDEKVKNLDPELANEQWKCFGNLISDEEAQARLKN